MFQLLFVSLTSLLFCITYATLFQTLTLLYVAGSMNLTIIWSNFNIRGKLLYLGQKEKIGTHYLTNITLGSVYFFILFTSLAGPITQQNLFFFFPLSLCFLPNDFDFFNTKLNVTNDDNEASSISFALLLPRRRQLRPTPRSSANSR
ncbi:hypothetical protein ISN44_As10g006380 [Arabidopsis suecica]|uniref:Uncharacterized protein n=1 Tax=Arabidopsis suecica TaxID=45249 RepID=A0A8T1ZWN5_ARASU|nr:hypothetical protein ISN44_As10g006380 [Arabidopsis suecica]KAG7563875.1 hypothetical protein ISN44_As10g006380 [Arabidopsis suecica]KAG7563876.1 hypothetical protein ISN44_As10g006380 [Arabidopsis suecica]KAG7563877.1 hypothetical protein ISN44_As10g006380 [Arabidopsis suecica]KAG7563878.1 hypothetical protein ISN44_As10g006380 [Arabidopsis suecica]